MIYEGEAAIKQIIRTYEIAKDLGAEDFAVITAEVGVLIERYGSALAEADELKRQLAARTDGRESVGYEWGVRRPDGTMEGRHNGAFARALVQGTDCTVMRRELRRFYGNWREADPMELAQLTPEKNDAECEPGTATDTTDNEGA